MPDGRRLLEEVGIGGTHVADDNVGQRGQSRLAAAEQPGVTHRPAQDPAQDIAASLVGGHDLIGQQERDGAGVVGEDAVGGAGRSAIVRPADQCRDPFEEGEEEIGVEVGLFALQDRSDPLEAGAGVHRRLGKRIQGPVGAAVELHEHEVPDFEELTRLGLLLELRTRQPCPAAPRPRGPTDIHVDLRARTARPRVAHLPEVVLVAQSEEPVVREARDLPPELPRLRRRSRAP